MLFNFIFVMKVIHKINNEIGIDAAAHCATLYRGLL